MYPKCLCTQSITCQESLPNDVDHEWVKKLFSSCGKVVYVSLPRYPSTGDLKGFGFVEFETIEGAEAACKVGLC